MGFSQTEVLNMTMRKFFLIFEEYLKMNGLKKEKKQISCIDDLP